MSFTNPDLLALLILPLAMAGAALLRTGVPVPAPVAAGSLQRRRGLSLFLALPTLFPPALVAIAIVLLAGPVQHEQSTGRVPKKLTNIQFCLNVSNSMLTKSFGPCCRYCASSDAVHHFARGREGDAFGLTLFGTTPIIWVPLSDDVSALYRAARLCYPDHMPEQINRFPDTAAGVRLSIDQIKDRGKGSGGRLLILMTDGEDPALPRHAEELTQLMIREDVTLHVLLFKHPGSCPTLAQMAQRTTHGQLSDCSSSHELEDAFRTIDRMHPIEYEVGTPQAVPDTRPWVVAAAVLLLLYLVSLFGVRYTPW
jgi:hypothetical protein